MFDDLIARLSAAGARTEALGVLEQGRRTLGVPRPDRIVTAGRVWRLGDVLLGLDGRLWQVGRVVRVAGTDRRRSVVATSITEHHELALAARRGGAAEGETVNFDATPLDPAPADLVALQPYLAERAELLIEAARGA